MDYKVMSEADIDSVIPMYLAYYNQIDGSKWTYETTYKRIHQVVSREDSYCLLLQGDSCPLAFAMGYCEQYDDLYAYDLVEIVVALENQNKGIGTALMRELEKRVKALGVSMIQLQSENDQMHEHFYEEKLQFQKAGNFILMSKWI